MGENGQNVFMTRWYELMQFIKAEFCLTMPVLTKNTTDISNHRANAINTRVASIQNVQDTFEPVKFRNAICSSQQNVTKANITI